MSLADSLTRLPGPERQGILERFPGCLPEMVRFSRNSELALAAFRSDCKIQLMISYDTTTEVFQTDKVVMETSVNNSSTHRGTIVEKASATAKTA